MRKLISIYLSLVLIIVGAVTAYASPPDNTITPYFNSIYNVAYTFNIDGSTADIKIRVMPKSNNEPDYVKVTAKLMKEGSSSPVKTWNETLYIDGVSFKFHKTKVLLSKGNYYLDANVKSYKDGKLVDTDSYISESKKY